MARRSTVFGLPVAGLLCLLVTYVVWGSTYLAIRVAVSEGAGWGPFWLGASRVFVAAAILLAVCLFRRVRIRPIRAVILIVIAGSGVLMWVGGNGAVNWAEQRIDSGLAALVVGAMPMWVVLIESIVDRRRPSTHLVGLPGRRFRGSRSPDAAHVARGPARAISPVSPRSLWLRSAGERGRCG